MKEKVSDEIIKRKIKKRILSYSDIYTESDLEDLSLEKIKEIQHSIFIPLILSVRFRNRN